MILDNGTDDEDGIDAELMDPLIEADVVAVTTDAEEYEDKDGGEGEGAEALEEDMASKELVGCF